MVGKQQLEHLTGYHMAYTSYNDITTKLSFISASNKAYGYTSIAYIVPKIGYLMCLCLFQFSYYGLPT